MINIKRMVAIINILILFITIAVSGCGKAADGKNESQEMKSGNNHEGDQTLPFVKLSYYTIAGELDDSGLVNEAINKILKEKINAEVTINNIGWADYQQKMHVMEAAGDEFDACFTAPWYNNFYVCSQKGYFKDITELLPIYAPKTWSSIREKIWDAARVDGRIYGILNQQIFPRQTAWAIRKDVADKLNLDYKLINNYKDFESKILKPIKEKLPAEETTQITGSFDFINYYPMYRWEDIAGTPGVINIDEKPLMVFNQYETPEYKDYILTMRDWNLKGYIPANALTTQYNDSKMYAFLAGTYKPGGGIELQANFGGVSEGYLVPSGKSAYYTSYTASAMTAIGANSRSPERALMFLELLNNDKELYNTFCFGIENIHYKKTGENSIKLIKGRPYYQGINWAFGNVFNGYLLPGMPEDTWEQTKKLNDETPVPEHFGFTFNVGSVISEVTHCAAVLEELEVPLKNGIYKDPEIKLKEMIKKLKVAGVDKIIREKQRQLDAYMSKK